MSDGIIKYKKYVDCIKDILVKTFEDKNLLIQFTLGIITLSVGISATIALPFLLKKIVDSFSSSAISSFSFILISYGLLWMVSQISLHARALLTYKIEQRLTFVLGIKVLSHLYSLSQRYFLDQKSGTITNIIRRAQMNVPSIILGIFFHLLPTVLEFLFVIVLIATLYPFMYSLLLAGILIIFFVYTLISMNSVLKTRQIANDLDKNVDGVVTDWLSNHEAIKIFGKRDLAINTCKKELKKREEAEVNFMTKLSLVRLGQSLILGLGLSSLTYIIGMAVLRKTLTVGDFVLFNGYIIQFIIPISIIGQVTQNIKKALLDMKGIIDILLTESEIKEASNPTHLSGDRFYIEFEDVSFKYKDRNILENLSFEVEPGETVLIVGATGIGKSTLAKLLLRLYDPIEGQILINKTNIKYLSFQSLYETIGWIPQESYLLNDTIKNNMLFARPEATPEDLEKALDRASLLGFVKNLPDGLNTHVGDRGLKLSGGEKQRLSLARLFLKNPKICIFDEATSFLDRNTELTIQNNIETYLPNMTKIIITHRPFMINKADKIITLDKRGVSLNKIPHEFDRYFARNLQRTAKSKEEYAY